MDIAGAQELFGCAGQLTRIDVRLQPGADRAALAAPAGAAGRRARGGRRRGRAARLSNLSRAYRVNLTVLALVALFTGAFLVFSVLALSVAQRAPQLRAARRAGPDGARAARAWCWPSRRARRGRQRARAGARHAAWRRCAALLAGDLGGGYFPGVAPALATGALGGRWLYGALGVAAALVGGWLPARRGRALPPAQTLKGLGAPSAGATAPAGPAWRCCWRRRGAGAAAAGGRPAAGGLRRRWPRCWSAASRWCRRRCRPCSRAACRHAARCGCWRWSARGTSAKASAAVAGVVASLAWRSR